MGLFPFPLKFCGFHGEKRGENRGCVTMLTECHCWGRESGSLSPPIGFQTDKKCEALMTICQGSPCLGSGAVTWVTATAIATAVGHQPWQGLFQVSSSIPCPTSKARRNALNYSRTKRPCLTASIPRRPTFCPLSHSDSRAFSLGWGETVYAPGQSLQGTEP